MSLDLVEISPSGAVPTSRIKDATSARTIYTSLQQDDLLASAQRARVQGMIDGNPPYDENELVELGQAGRTNVNWGGAKSRIDDALIPHYDMVTSVPTYATIRTSVGGPTVSSEYGRIISEEFHRMLDDWDSFLYQIQLSQSQKVIHGLGPCFWKDERDWRPTALKRRNFLIPSNTKASTDDLKVAFIIDYMEVDELYRYIEKPEVADRTGWKTEQVKCAIRGAGNTEEDRAMSWEWWQEQLKDNNFYISYARTKTVEILHAFVKEFDGKVSHHILTRDPLIEGKDNYLFSKIGRFDKWRHVLRLFYDTVGNGDMRSIRGLGQDVYKFGEASNRLNNTIIDGAIQASCRLWQAGTGSDIGKFAAIEIGPDRVVPPGLNLLPFNNGQNIQSAIAVAGHFQMVEANQTGAYKGSMTKGGNPVTAEEIIAQQGEKAKITSAKAQHYLIDLDGYYTEMYRRASASGLMKIDPGGEEALAFQKRCTDRGVPVEAIRNVDSVKATRAIGNGSAPGRRMAMLNMQPLMPFMPEEKKKVFVRDLIAATADDQGAADRYGPDLNPQPPGMDDWQASVENGSLMTGTPVVITDQQNHFIHVTYHINFMLGLMNEVQDGLLDPKSADLAFQDAGPHTVQHLEYLAQNPLRVNELKEFQEQLSEIMKFADQLHGEAERLRQEEADQGIPGDDAWLEAIQERINLNWKDLAPDSKNKFLEMIGLGASQMESPADANLRIKQEQLGLKSQKQAVDTAKTRQGMAISDITTAVDIKEKLNGNDKNGSKAE